MGSAGLPYFWPDEVYPPVYVKPLFRVGRETREKRALRLRLEVEESWSSNPLPVYRDTKEAPNVDDAANTDDDDSTPNMTG